MDSSATPAAGTRWSIALYPRLFVLAYEHMAAAAADRQPVEITGSFRFSLPPLGRLAHADAAESIAYLAVAGVLQHAVTDGGLQRLRIGVEPGALVKQAQGHRRRRAPDTLQHDIPLILALCITEHPPLRLLHHI